MLSARTFASQGKLAACVSDGTLLLPFGFVLNAAGDISVCRLAKLYLVYQPLRQKMSGAMHGNVLRRLLSLPANLSTSGRPAQCSATPGPAASTTAVQDSEFAQLLSPAPTDVFGVPQRAKSASDAGVLRRKGRLKEQDALIDFICDMHNTHTCEETMSKLERWVQVRSTLSSMRGYIRFFRCPWVVCTPAPPC